MDGILSLTIYDGLIKKIIYDIKYNYYFAMAETLGKVMSDYLNFYNFNSTNSILTFVPTSKKKLRIRGFNQSEMLANQLAKRSGIKVCNFLNKKKNTGAQAKLGKESRAENLKDAFEMSSEQKLPQGIKNIIIVDDVFTTGATLNECAKVIKQRFSEARAFGFVIAKARG